MDSRLNLQGKVALVTGGASGIGLASAHEFARHGAKIGLLDFHAHPLHEAAEELRSTGAEVEELAADVSDWMATQSAIEQLVARFGRLDVVHANAGINGVWAPIEEISPDEFDRTLGINLRGTFLTIKYATPYLKRHGGAVIVTSSVNGTRIFSNTGATAYSASKAGQVAITKMLAVELGQHGIRVNAICPGAIHTHIDASTEQRETDAIKIPVEYPEGSNPLTGNHPGNPEDIARAALYLASDMSGHINGEVLYVDGGQSLVQG